MFKKFILALAIAVMPLAIYHHDKTVSAQTAPYTCSSGSFVNAQLVNTGQTCATSSITVNSVSCALGGSCTIPTGLTSIGSCTVAQTATVSISAGPRTVSSTCSGVVSGGSYLIVESPASLTSYPGYGLFAGAAGTAANTLQVTLYGPLLAIGGNYTITYAVFRIA